MKKIILVAAAAAVIALTGCEAVSEGIDSLNPPPEPEVAWSPEQEAIIDGFENLMTEQMRDMTCDEWRTMPAKFYQDFKTGFALTAPPGTPPLYRSEVDEVMEYVCW